MAEFDPLTREEGLRHQAQVVAAKISWAFVCVDCITYTTGVNVVQTDLPYAEVTWYNPAQTCLNVLAGVLDLPDGCVDLTVEVPKAVAGLLVRLEEVESELSVLQVEGLF